jgi:hypothetical protein
MFAGQRGFADVRVDLLTCAIPSRQEKTSMPPALLRERLPYSSC